MLGASNTPNIVPINAFAKDRVGPHSRSRACPNPEPNWPPSGRRPPMSRASRHKPQSPLKAIRAKCFDCSYYQVSEIRLCEAVNCALWPFRAGKHPWWGEGEKTCQTLADPEREMASERWGRGMIRRTLPQRRASETFDLRFWNQPFTVTVGCYADGAPGEVFIDGGKTGQDIQSTARDAAVVLSLALQHGTPIEAIRHAVTRNGSGEAASILGATVDRLATVSVRAADDRP